MSYKHESGYEKRKAAEVRAKIAEEAKAEPTFGQPQAGKSWRGVVVVPCVGGGWAEVEVEIPQADLERYQRKPIPHGDYRPMVMARVKTWFADPELARKWW